jgi:hypothetical protein
MNVELNLEKLEQIAEALNQKHDALSRGGTEVLPELQAVNRLRELREEHENNHDLSREEVHHAYNMVRGRQLGSAVFISDLASELQIRVPKLHEWIRREFHSLVFSAGERESAYVIDGLMHNDVVSSDIHSTDSFGFSEAIFGVSHLLGFSYAPRLKNLKRQRLYTFKSRRDIDRSPWQIKPTGYIDTEFIEQNWDDILRLIATIKLKETTASEIFRRLNSDSQEHSLYRALKGFGKVIKSIFLLRYIDEVELPQAIECQLNKIEHAHRFARAVSVGNPREFIQAEKQEQEIAEDCKRLIKNCITCWNYLYLG